MSNRNTFIQECECDYPSLTMLKHQLELAKGKALDNTYTCTTGFTNKDNSSFVSLIRYWLASLLATHSAIPKMRIIYQGAYPEYLEDIPNCTLVPNLWQLAVANTGVAKFNFTMKIQALMGALSPHAAWLDVDAVFLRSLKPEITRTSFIAKPRRVAGGFYSLCEKDRQKFYPILLSFLEEKVSTKGKLNSDQKMLLHTLKKAGIDWHNANSVYETGLLHLSRSKVRDSRFREKYRSHLQWIAS